VDAAKFAASVIRRHVPDTACRVVLFGSRSAGGRSDIEIGIEIPATVSRVALAAIHDEFEEARRFIRRGRRFRARSENSVSRRASECAVTKAESLRLDFAKAVARLDEALTLPKDLIVRDSAIQHRSVPGAAVGGRA
jgi:predicted nucleotidyltransferase